MGDGIERLYRYELAGTGGEATESRPVELPTAMRR
jgi:hypothetical protein